MQILLAAGAFFPDIGGPAIHVRKIAERLKKEGFRPVVVAYGDDPSNTDLGFKIIRISRKFPKILQWFFYFLIIFIYAPFSKLVYAFDPTSAGLPACLIAKIFRKPFIIRIGGDPIWEREVEKGRRLMPIKKYYELGLHKKDKSLLFKTIKFVVRKANAIIVSNNFFGAFYQNYYGVEKNKIEFINNPLFKREDSSFVLPNEPVILFGGRFVSYKNLPLVIEAFKEVGIGKLSLIGSGPDKNKLIELVNSMDLKEKVLFFDPMTQENLFQYIKESSICIGPALSEFSPNFILEALSFGKPVLLSKGHGLSLNLPEEFLFDPENKEELKQKLVYLFNEKNYEKAVSDVRDLPMDNSWEKVTGDNIMVIKKFI